MLRLKYSGQGTRADNQDYIIVQNIRAGRRRYSLLIACDGIGGRPDGKRCSEAIGTAACTAITDYLARRSSRRSLGALDAYQIKQQLSNLHAVGATLESGTTLISVVMSHHSGCKGNSAIVVSAGDSRAYAMNDMSNFEKLTNDHHNEDGHLTSFYTGDGSLYGELFIRLLYLNPFATICVTTDGIHGACSDTELHMFLQACKLSGVNSDSQLGEALHYFLENNISDNFTLGLIYHPISHYNLKTIQRRNNHGNSCQ